jgi:hypothetical protein
LHFWHIRDPSRASMSTSSSGHNMLICEEVFKFFAYLSNNNRNVLGKVALNMGDEISI